MVFISRLLLYRTRNLGLHGKLQSLQRVTYVVPRPPNCVKTHNYPNVKLPFLLSTKLTLNGSHIGHIRMFMRNYALQPFSATDNIAMKFADLKHHQNIENNIATQGFHSWPATRCKDFGRCHKVQLGRGAEELEKWIKVSNSDPFCLKTSISIILKGFIPLPCS